MRSAVWVVLLMLVPLASGTTLLWPDEVEPIGSEHLLVLEEGVWTSQQWASLTEQGIQPLRTVDPQTLLVWGDMEDVTLPADFTIQKAPPAEYKPGLAPSNGPEEFRVLLEPRLPDRGVENVQQALEAFGFPVLSSSLDVRGNVPASLTVRASDVSDLNPLLQTDGVLWVEPVLSTQARNGQASAMIESGELGHHPFWELGLNASGIVLGVADSGIDADHACFRNATTPTSVHAEGDAVYPAVGVFNEDHRKILHLNTSVDGNDTPGHSDYRHGTHVIGSLACHDVFSARQGHMPNNGSSLAYGSSLVIQDIVSADGWSPPDVDRLLWETSAYGGVVHSDSWGDDTTAYTQRTGLFDAYAKAMPWSLAVIAPGNSGEGVLEPANGRNVVAVGASTKDVNEGRWGSSAYGPTESGTDGIFLLAPGSNIQSAGADGFWDTNNANLRLSSGTSMATPLAAGAAGVVQQLYEDGWIVPAHAATEPHNMSALQPTWAEAPPVQSIELGEGFTPSGSLLRASLAMATSPLPQSVRSGGEGGYELHNPYDGWGMLNLSELLNPALLVDGQSPSEDLWIHDSYRLKSGTVHEWFSANKGAEGNLSGMLTSSWSGDGSVGPFLQTGDLFTQRFVPLAEQDVRIRLAFPAQPEPAMVDDIQLRVRLEDGTILLPDRLQEGDYAPTQFYPSATDTNDTTAFPSSNETVVGLDIPWHYLNGSSHMEVDVIARFVQPGNILGSVGLDGDAVGFALVVKGVERDSSQPYDSDGDGVADSEEIAGCTNFFANNYNPEATDDDGSCDWDLDDDGIWDIDDRDMDGDGVLNIDEVVGCTNILANNYNAEATDDDGSCDFDLDNDGILDADDTDMDGDGVSNDDDLCPSHNAGFPDENQDGCPDSPPEQWNMIVRFNEGCLGCSISIGGVAVKVDGVKVYEKDWENALSLKFDGCCETQWDHLLNQHAQFDGENFEEVELEIDMKFTYVSPYTSGRQWVNDPCWPVGCFNGPHTWAWNVDVELSDNLTTHQARIANILSIVYPSHPFETHTFTWSNEPVIDDDKDGYSVPGLVYDGVCHEEDISSIVLYRNRYCDVTRYNVNDLYPTDGTQWADTDGDGRGDNASGNRGDQFPDDGSEWNDEDRDGYGDNSDACPARFGQINAGGCPDSDNDGYPDVIDDYGRAWGYNGELYACGSNWEGCNSPSNEGPEMAIDGNYDTKYLNFGKYRTGIIITPKSASTVKGIELVSANDEWSRDPTSFHLYGTNEAVNSRDNSKGEGEDWAVIGTGEIKLPYDRHSSSGRIHINNTVEYKSYKLIFPTVKGNYNSMQVAEIQFFDANGEAIFTSEDAVIAVHDPPSETLMLYAGQAGKWEGGRWVALQTDDCPNLPGTAYRSDSAGCPDSDGDGWADPGTSLLEEDMCPDEPGDATTSSGKGCPDSDGDGWADFEDDLPHNHDYHLDSDGDGMPDEHDAFPQNAFFSSVDDVFNLACLLLLGVVAVFVLFAGRRNKNPPPSLNMEPQTVVVGYIEENDPSTTRDGFW